MKISYHFRLLLKPFPFLQMSHVFYRCPSSKSVAGFSSKSEWLKLEGTSGNCLVYAPAQCSLLEKNGNCRMLLGNLLQCLTTMTVKKIIFFFLLVFCLCLLPCLLSLETTMRSPTLLSYHLPQQIFIYIDKISSFFSKINYFWGPLGLLEYIVWRSPQLDSAFQMYITSAE